MPRLTPPSKDQSLLLPPYLQLQDSAILVPRTEADFAQARHALLNQRVLGFDTESKPIFHVNQPDHGPHVVQLATPEAAWILQLHHSQALEIARAVLASPEICKVGFGLDNDKSTLPRRLGITLAHIVDLDTRFKQHGYGSSTGVRAAVALVLGQNFHKSKKQSTSNWAAEQLSPAQIRYAANDAHAPACIWAALPAWEAQQPPLSTRAPRPARLRAPDHAPLTPAPTTPPADLPHTPRSSGRQVAALLQRPPQPRNKAP